MEMIFSVVFLDALIVLASTKFNKSLFEISRYISPEAYSEPIQTSFRENSERLSAS